MNKDQQILAEKISQLEDEYESSLMTRRQFESQLLELVMAEKEKERKEVIEKYERMEWDFTPERKYFLFWLKKPHTSSPVEGVLEEKHSTGSPSEKETIVCPHPVKWIRWDKKAVWCDKCEQEFALPQPKEGREGKK